ncbi:MAG: Unknown protein [uncultured Sulfurovum sp.]|uniref:Uncharacterized protein n=1 Tax=uncultured Sulfurovum sp. TaxID=269237 RepID=A0A6S6SP48_9BACT|nr:MAG: Unknown protein [uncultured Sulfurovum sp.]
MKTSTIEYSKQTTKITLNTYDDGFFLSEIDITDVVLTLALEKLYDDYGLEQGDELHIRKKKSLGSVTKIELMKSRKNEDKK